MMRVLTERFLIKMRRCYGNRVNREASVPPEEQFYLSFILCDHPKPQSHERPWFTPLSVCSFRGKPFSQSLYKHEVLQGMTSLAIPGTVICLFIFMIIPLVSFSSSLLTPGFKVLQDSWGKSKSHFWQ